MKKTTLRYAFMIIGFTGIIALAFPTYPVAAQPADQDPAQLEKHPGSDDRPDGQRPGRRPPRRGGGPLMRVLDIDKDGQLSADEMKNAAEVLKTLDKNGDGALSRDELRPPRPPRRGQQD